MTHDTVDLRKENSGSYWTVFHTIDITSLDEAGIEDYDVEAETGLSPFGVTNVGRENGDYLVAYNTADGELNVTDPSDNSDVTSGTDVGEVILRVDGV